VWFMNGSDCRFPRKDVPLHVCDTIIESYSAKGVSGSIHGLGFVAFVCSMVVESGVVCREMACDGARLGARFRLWGFVRFSVSWCSLVVVEGLAMFLRRIVL